MLTMAMPEQNKRYSTTTTAAARGQHAKSALNFHESGNRVTCNNNNNNTAQQ